MLLVPSSLFCDIMPWPVLDLACSLDRAFARLFCFFSYGSFFFVSSTVVPSSRATRSVRSQGSQTDKNGAMHSCAMHVLQTLSKQCVDS